MNRLGLALGLSSLLVGSACGQITKKEGNFYLFRLNLTKGRELHYRAPVSIEGLGQNGSIKFKLKLDVKVVKVAGGFATIRGHLDAGKVNGTQIFEPKDISFKVDNRGQVSDATGALGGFTVQFPQFPVKLGSTFVASVPVLLGDNPAQSQSIEPHDATFTFQGFVGTGPKRAAKLAFVVAGNLAPSGAMLISAADGTMLKYTTKFYLHTQDAKPLVVTASFIRE